jgi:hypothetical protein
MKSGYSYGGIKTETISPMGIFSLWVLVFTLFPIGTYLFLPEFFTSTLIFAGVTMLLVALFIAGVTFKWPGFEKL